MIQRMVGSTITSEGTAAPDDAPTERTVIVTVQGDSDR